MPAISSGELFFRTRNSIKESWLCDSLGTELRSFLGVGTAEVNNKNYFAQKSMLDEAEKLSLSCHQSMCRALELHTINAEQLCKSFLSRAKTTDSGFRQGEIDLIHEYDNRCGHLALWYFAALEREQDIYRRRMEEESLACNRLSMQVKESLRLSVFAIHLESETDSQILLKRLPPAHPQHVRCRRAASENIKPGFFDGAPPFNGINVLDVYKVENAPELDRFQKRAAAMEPGKVKGLFTSVSGAAIERIIALGMGGGDSSSFGSSSTNNTPGSNSSNQNDRHIFRRAWYAYHNNKSEVGYAENRIRKSQRCQFPRSFSRYSTLEADRSAIESAATTAVKQQEGTGTGAEAGAGAGAGKGKALSSSDGGGAVNDNIRYLVLCRVAVGKVFVTSKEYKGFPSVGTDPAFDSMYNPLQEEYLILRPRQVLPEFVIQYVLKKNPASTTPVVPVALPPASASASASTSSPTAASSSSAVVHSNDTPVLPIDLSSPHVVLPPSGTAWRINLATKDNNDKNSLVAPLPFSTSRTTMATAWGGSGGSGTAAGGPSSNATTGAHASPTVLAAEITRREQLTSWEQLRLNAARQRETLLEKTQGLHNTYRQFNAKLRVRLVYLWLCR